MKWCPQCSTKKPAEDFGTNAARSDGLQTWCRECTRVKNRERYLKRKGIEPTVTEKKCSTCALELPVSEYDRNAASKDGYQTVCRNCTRQYKRERYANGDSAIYFMQMKAWCECGDNPIKIGLTTGLTKRLESANTWSPRGVRLLGLLPGGQDVERSLHDRFRHLRMDGEWFRPAPDLWEFIAIETIDPDEVDGYGNPVVLSHLKGGQDSE